MAKRKKSRQYRQGTATNVADDDTICGWAPHTVFMTCATRGQLWHVADRQTMNTIIMPKMTACGIKPYQGAECRREWAGFDAVLVCSTCRSIAVDF